MATRIIKTIKGRRYYYLQRSYRRGGRVLTKSIYLGPVDAPKRKKRKLDLRGLAPGIAAIGIHVLLNGLKSPQYKTRDRISGRTIQANKQALLALYKSYGLDLSSPQALQQTRALLSADQEQELMHKVLALGREQHAGRAKGEVSPEIREFNERLKAHKAAQDARQAAQNAPGRTEAPVAKNFTVDDEIEAREAKFEAAVDEYNAGTTAAPDSPAPDDAVSGEGGADGPEGAGGEAK
jgi:hypothetical protein